MTTSDPEDNQFDPDFSPDNEHNRQVAESKGVRFDPIRDSYVDEDGCLTHDRYGQEY